MIVLFAVSGCASRRPADSVARYELTGTVSAVPGCAGPVRLDSSCPPRAVSGAHVDVDVNGSAVGSTTTDGQGHFELRLPAGRYEVIVVNSGGYRSSATRMVSLDADTDITVSVDSGMR
jgi:carboxypeptidase family protein